MRTILCVLALAWPALGQVMVQLDSQTMLMISTRMNDAKGETVGIRGEVTVGGNEVHRVLRDPGGRIVFAYDLEVAGPVTGPPFRIRVKPLSAGYSRTLQATPLATFESEREVVVSPGGTATIELLAQPGTGRKIVDVLEALDRPAVAAMAQAEAVRNVPSTSDQLHVSHGQIWSGGTIVSLVEGSMTGNNVGIHLNGRGALFVATDDPKAYTQFQKIGTVEGNRLKFVWAGRPYELVCDEPILPSGARGEVWVYFDPQYMSKSPGDWSVAAGSLKFLMQKEE
jgi:hypothetical protein